MKRSFERSFDALAEIFDFTREFFAAECVDEQHRTEVDFAIEEIFTNMVKYNDGRFDIELMLSSRNDELTIRLADEDVEQFDVTALPEVDPSTPVEKRRAGGMGVHLVRRLSDRFSYDYRDRTSIVTVVKKLDMDGG